MAKSAKLVGFLAGSMENQPDMLAKYGHFFESIAAHFELLRVFDVSLKGYDRWMNIATSFDLNMRKWKERSFKNVQAFKRRSLNASNYLSAYEGAYDYALQIGVLYEIKTKNRTLIYTDYTSALSASRPDSGRSPFTPKELAAWLKLERSAYQNARHIFVRSQLVKKSMVDSYGIPETKISAVGGGLNFELPSSIRPESEVYKQPTILFIGKDFYRKGGDIMLKAFDMLKQQVPDAKLLMLTADPIADGYPLAGVEMIAPTWERAEIEALYRQASLFVLPSRLETWGDVLLEAMAFELPCIGVTGQSMEDIILGGETGFVVAPEDPAALSQAMCQVLTEPEKAASFGKNGRQRVENEFTWNSVVVRIKNVLSTINYEME